MAGVQKRQAPAKKPARKPVRKPVKKPAAADSAASCITVGGKAAAQLAAPAALPGPAATLTAPATQLMAPMLNAISLSAELRNNARELLALVRDNRPASTQRAYVPKQEEYSAFCREYGFPDGETVTDDKLLLFLRVKVIDRPLKMRSRNDNDSINAEDTRLSWRSVRQYVTAITDLWRLQKSLGMNSHPSPRDHTARELVKTIQGMEADRQKAAFADKGRDSLRDGYSEPQLQQICCGLWERTGETTALQAEIHLRTIVDILLGHYLLTRGGDRRNVELSDLQTFELAEEGPTRCFPVIMTTRAGKQNQHGRLETAGALRNRDPFSCLLSSLGFYLLFRWDLTSEPFPDFTERSRWYPIRLLKSSGGTSASQGLSYGSQRDWAAKAFEYAGIRSSKKTHIGRSSGAKLAEVKGVTEDQIRRAGRWNQEQMIGCYLTALPREFMRVMAGHPKKKGRFEIIRARVPPPGSLLPLIWPELDQYAGRFGPNDGQIDDLAGHGFTDLLFHLREVILQDSVALRCRFPKSAVWNHPVFDHKDYLRFAAQVAAVMEEGERPNQLALLEAAIPTLTDFLRSSDTRNQALMAGVATKADLQVMGAQLAEALRDSVGEMLDSAVFKLARPPLAAGPAQPLFASAPAVTPAPPAAFVPPAPSPAPSVPSSLASLAPPPPAASSASTSSVSGQSHRSVTPEGAGPPAYRMSRSVKTVTDLWREWTVGIGGGPAIASLDARWGFRWRSGRGRHAEAEFYSQRLEVIREIRRVAQARRIDEDAAAAFVGAEYRQLAFSSLAGYCKQLRVNRKKREAG